MLLPHEQCYDALDTNRKGKDCMRGTICFTAYNLRNPALWSRSPRDTSTQCWTGARPGEASQLMKSLQPARRDAIGVRFLRQQTCNDRDYMSPGLHLLAVGIQRIGRSSLPLPTAPHLPCCYCNRWSVVGSLCLLPPFIDINTCCCQAFSTLCDDFQQSAWIAQAKV